MIGPPGDHDGCLALPWRRSREGCRGRRGVQARALGGITSQALAPASCSGREADEAAVSLARLGSEATETPGWEEAGSVDSSRGAAVRPGGQGGRRCCGLGTCPGIAVTAPGCCDPCVLSRNTCSGQTLRKKDPASQCLPQPQPVHKAPLQGITLEGGPVGAGGA